MCVHFPCLRTASRTFPVVSIFNTCERFHPGSAFDFRVVYLGVVCPPSGAAGLSSASSTHHGSGPERRGPTLRAVNPPSPSGGENEERAALRWPSGLHMSLPVLLPGSCCPVAGAPQLAEQPYRTRPRGPSASSRVPGGGSRLLLPGRPLLSLGLLQLLLGGSMVALCFGARSLSSAAPVRTSCPFWAGSSVSRSRVEWRLWSQSSSASR